MADYTYGLLGTPKYTSATKEWKFSRQRGQGKKLLPLGERHELISPFKNLSSNSTNHAKLSHIHHATTATTARLMHDVPNLAPAASFINDFVAESKVLDDAASLSDTLSGRLLSICYDRTEDAIQSPILVYATGLNLSDLAITRILQTTTILDHEDEEETTESSILQAQNPILIHLSMPIRQLCFAAVKSSGRQRLVVRTDAGIHIFRLGNRRVKIHIDDSDILQLALLTPAMVEGRIFCQVDVNPWNEHQIVVIDEYGCWSVWECKVCYSPKETRYTMEKLHEGVLKPEQKSGDGWAGIKWAHDAGHLVACQGMQLFEIDITVSLPSVTQFVDHRKRSIYWRYLDIVKSNTHTDLLYLLSNYSITAFNIKNGASVVMNIQHQRHPDDASLSLEEVDMRSPTSLVVHSKLNPEITAFPIKNGEDNLVIPAGEAYMLEMPNKLSTRLALGILQIAQESSSIYVCSMHKDQSITAQHFGTPNSENEEDPLSTILGITSKKLRRPRAFVVPEKKKALGIVDVNGSLVADFHSTKLETRQQGYNFHKLYNYAFDENVPEYKTTRNTKATNAQFLTNADDILDVMSLTNGEQSFTGLQFDAPSNLFENLSEVFKKLKDKLDAYQTEDGKLVSYRISNIGKTVNGNGEEGDASVLPEDLDVEKMYNEILNDWLNPLPVNMPAKVRLRRERLARMIATDKCLSSMGFFFDNEEEEGFTDTVEERESSMQLSENEKGKEKENSTRLFLNNFTPLTNIQSLDHDFDALLDDWNTEIPPTEYVWKRLETHDNSQNSSQRSNSARSSRSRSRSCSRPLSRSGAGLAAESAHLIKVQESLHIPASKPQAYPPVPVGLGSGGFHTRVSREVGLSQMIAASQGERGKYGSRKKAQAAKRKRIEGF